MYKDYQASNDYVGGDCMIGTKGKPCAVEVVKRMVLNLDSLKWTMTIDMCRGLAMRGGERKEGMTLELP